jgi:hypothetical protein
VYARYATAEARNTVAIALKAKRKPKSLIYHSISGGIFRRPNMIVVLIEIT